MEVIDFLPGSVNRTEFESRGVVETQYFDKERKFRKVLEKSRFIFPFSVDEIVEHERVHVETARSLGYNAQYCLSNNGTDYQPGAYINNGNIREIPIDDLIAILSAPRILGEDDELKLRNLKVFKIFYRDN